MRSGRYSPPFAQALRVGLLLPFLFVCASGAGEQEKHPSPIRYFNEFQGVYVGDKQPNGKTRVILHRKGRRDYPEVHLVKRQTTCPRRFVAT